MRRVAALSALIVVTAPVWSMAQDASSIQGVWLLTEISVEGGPHAGTHTEDVQPGILIVTDDYYASMRVPTAMAGFQPRALIGTSPTDAQQLAAFRPFFAGVGTYEWDGTTITRDPLIARAPNRMVPGFTDTRNMRVDGDTLILSFEGGPGWDGSTLTELRYARVTDGATSPLDGVWKKVATRFDEGPPDLAGTFNSDVQPDYLIIAEGHYSRILVRGRAPRPALPEEPTDEEQLAAFGFAFDADAGTFDFDGSTFTKHPIVAKIPDNMAPGSSVDHAARHDGDVLWLNWRGGAAAGVDKYVRVEPFSDDN